jgi:cystathionine beta-lyase family protein involved in aluminum resistance
VKTRLSQQSKLDIDSDLMELFRKGREVERAGLLRIENNLRDNFRKVLEAFRSVGISDQDFAGTTGYGYDDRGREVTEEVYAKVFGTESALVRHQIASGTQALSLCLFGLLLPGDEILFATGKPYDTLQAVVGMDKQTPGCLAELGITWKVAPVATGEDSASGDSFTEARDSEALAVLDERKNDVIADSMGSRTKVVFIQRSRGYSWQRSVSCGTISKIAKAVKARNRDVVVVVDNCYGEFTETVEPTEVGADIAAGSLIKNPGGGIAPTGGYIVGRKDLVDRIATRLTAPGIGGEIGPSLNTSRLMLQGLFLAPQMVAESLSGTCVAGHVFRSLGYPVLPDAKEIPSDNVLAVRMGDEERLLTFCQGFHVAGPVNAFYKPIASPLPGYAHNVIMAGGTFVQGSSSELTVDAPICPPYIMYMQGGLFRYHVELAVLSGLTALKKRNLLWPSASTETTTEARADS